LAGTTELLQIEEDVLPEDARPMVAVWETLPSVAVRVAL